MNYNNPHELLNAIRTETDCNLLKNYYLPELQCERCKKDTIHIYQGKEEHPFTDLENYPLIFYRCVECSNIMSMP